MENRGRPSIDYPPTKKPSMLDIAWFAGIYEGEGCVTRQGNQIVILISQKERWLLDRVVELFGGRAYENPYKGEMRYVYRISNARGLGVIYTIYSFLSPHKRAQINNMITQVISCH